MSKIFLFMMTTLDGFFEGPDHDISWHHVDEEFNDFAIKQMQEAGTILFGRRTYQLMESFWPSKEGLEGDPEVAKLMNETPKIVVSKSLSEAHETKIWKNVTLLHDVGPKEIKILRQAQERNGKDIIVLASSNLCVSLIEQNLLDEIRIMINPVVIDKGTRLFEGLKQPLKLKLTITRKFQNGNILLTYSVNQKLGS